MTPEDRFATLTFTRALPVPPLTLWRVWTDPPARAAWAAPAPGVTVEFLQADTRPGGHEVSICRVAGAPDIRCEVGWLALEPPRISVNSEVLLREGRALSAALVTAEVAPTADGSRLTVTVQLSALAEDMTEGYRAGFGAGLDNLAGVAGRTMVIEGVIDAPVAAVWAAWTDPESLQSWWGPDGFSCRTRRIDLRAGGDWVFDMIGPDGTVYPNHHRYGAMVPGARIAYTLLRGEDGPKHAGAWASFADEDGRTRVTLAMTLVSEEEYRTALGFGAEELGLQTLGKLAAKVAARAGSVHRTG